MYRFEEPAQRQEPASSQVAGGSFMHLYSKRLLTVCFTQSSFLGAKGAAMNKADMIPALMGPHSKIRSFTSLLSVTNEKNKDIRRVCNREAYHNPKGQGSFLSGSDI